MTTQTESTPEEIEGLGDDLDASWGDYPIDEILIRNENQAIEQVLGRIEQGRYVMDPDFQRDFIWDEAKQSKLIESVLMRIPLPVFYLAEDQQGRRIVVDGLQRLSTFQRFARNELRLNLPDRPVLHRKRFEDLHSKLQDRFGDSNITLYVIDAKAPDQTRLDIFERVNSGVPLTRQQMRNCLYMGEATRFLREESRNDLFLEATGRSLRASIMRDREFVNRFCAFQILDLEDYRDMDEFLASCLKKMNAEPELLPTLSKRLETTLGNNLHLFGRHAFRKHESDQDYRNVINASLWDVMSNGLSFFPSKVVEGKSAAAREEFYRLMEEEDFIHSITYGTNAVRQVRKRFAMAEAMFKDVFGAYPD
jgi:hypothetical protein